VLNARYSCACAVDLKFLNFAGICVLELQIRIPQEIRHMTGVAVNPKFAPGPPPKYGEIRIRHMSGE